MLPKRIGLISAFILTICVHSVLFGTLFFTFPLQVAPLKPSFVYLGSFLRSDDFMISSGSGNVSQQIQSGQEINLDIRLGSSQRQLEKPNLSGRIQSAEKFQFRPKLEQSPRQIKVDTSEELDVDLTPFPVIRMKLDQNDQD